MKRGIAMSKLNVIIEDDGTKLIKVVNFPGGGLQASLCGSRL